ncbi:hypothetical protein HHK36_018154 [Tetracentron sinense]|uniref:Uncharacterized protein n=1 Tax=Tetracentron sinense TaxID=13715 RepID=A0A834YY16_TETSI|nr:hypothetical protein HHK36_018154 [Tetracentron sinense]
MGSSSLPLGDDVKQCQSQLDRWIPSFSPLNPSTRATLTSYATKVSDAILDTCLEKDPESKVACETCTKTNMVMVFSEITTKAKVNYEKIVRDTCRGIGFVSADVGLDADNCKLTEVRKNGTCQWLRLDGKTQVTVEYWNENGAMVPLRVHTALISIQHDETVTNNQIAIVVDTVSGRLQRVVASGLVQVSYAIGVPEPLSVFMDTYKTGKIPDKDILDLIKENFDFRSEMIFINLDLKRGGNIRFQKTAAFGHFGCGTQISTGRLSSSSSMTKLSSIYNLHTGYLLRIV